MREDLEEGSEVLRLGVTDPDVDSQLKLYVLAGDPQLQFAMDEAQPGLLYLRRALDRETRDTYELTVLASDSRHTATASVLVNVLDANGL